jgi:hypothetical protein
MRIILIDNNSGYIFGDSADFAAGVQIESCEQAAQLLDESIGEHGRTYTHSSRADGSDRTGYHCYRADIDGSEAVALVQDGQDQETIDNVVSSCKYVGFVACERAE